MTDAEYTRHLEAEDRLLEVSDAEQRTLQELRTALLREHLTDEQFVAALRGRSQDA